VVLARITSAAQASLTRLLGWMADPQGRDPLAGTVVPGPEVLEGVNVLIR
jgi:hypothetical protein